jgi:ribosomal protein L11 methyltransferase
MQRWIEVEFNLAGELAEPVAELLVRLAPQGVAVERDPAAAGDTVRLRAWLPDDPALPTRQRELEEGLWHLSQIQPIPEPSFRTIPQEGWSDAWRDLHHPLPVGKRLLVLPPWATAPDDSRLALRIEPGMAFGTGTHPTTRHCLEYLEGLVQPGMLVADLGCGSGILGIAAARLGARQVLAYDSDPEAVAAARENAVRNGVEHVLHIQLGSLADLRVQPAVQHAEVHLLVANIHAGALEQMLAQGLGEIVARSGRIVLSGILEDQAEALVAAAEAGGLALVADRSEGDWRTLLLERKPPQR